MIAQTEMAPGKPITNFLKVNHLGLKDGVNGIFWKHSNGMKAADGDDFNGLFIL